MDRHLEQPTAHYQNVGGMNEKASKYMTGLMEFLQLVNFELETPGAISTRPGSTQFLVAGTSGQVNNLYEFKKSGGFSQIVASANTGIYYVTAGRTLAAVATGYTSGTYTDMQTFADWLWLANGQTLLKYDGTNLRRFGLPIPSQNEQYVGSTANGSSTGMLLYARYLCGFVNERGFFGPVAYVGGFNNSASNGASSNYLVAVNGNVTPANYSAFAVKYVAIYRSDESFTTIAGVQQKSGIYHLLSMEAPSVGVATGFSDIFGATSLVNQEVFKRGVEEFRFTQSAAYVGATLTTVVRIPSFVEVHQNSMFFAGISSMPSTLWFSELGNPEDIQPEYNFEVRTEDGDQIKAMKSFNKQLVVFKEDSFHKVIGDNPSNYELVEISTEYGALSDRAVVTVDGLCYFIDKKGIVLYDGSNWRIISDNMEPTFRRMNISAAKNQAVAAHYDFRKQIWFSFPIDSSTVNNVTVVYDYEKKAWFKFDGFKPSSLVRMDAGIGQRNLFFGDYSGMIHHFSPSFLADNGVAISAIAQPRFDMPQGPYATAQFRRLWLDNDPAGVSSAISVQILSDLSNTAITTMTAGMSGFQSRLEFGVQAKALSFIFAHRHASVRCQINGWAIAHRVLRDL